VPVPDDDDAIREAEDAVHVVRSVHAAALGQIRVHRDERKRPRRTRQ
jgi:hypothetical protein